MDQGVAPMEAITAVVSQVGVPVAVSIVFLWAVRHMILIVIPRMQDQRERDQQSFLEALERSETRWREAFREITLEIRSLRDEVRAYRPPTEF